MTYYNGAALAGGKFIDNLDAATAALSGGWAETAYGYNAADPATTANIQALGERIISNDPNIAALVAQYRDKLGLDPMQLSTLATAIGAAFAMDTAMMSEDPEKMAQITAFINSVEGLRKVYNSVRRKIHIGSSVKAPLAPGESILIAARKARARADRIASLRTGTWWGSDPYMPGSRDRYGTYKNLYMLPTRKGEPGVKRERISVFGRPIPTIDRKALIKAEQARISPQFTGPLFSQAGRKRPNTSMEI